jgi:hypothetical protein
MRDGSRLISAIAADEQAESRSERETDRAAADRTPKPHGGCSMKIAAIARSRRGTAAAKTRIHDQKADQRADRYTHCDQDAAMQHAHGS